MNPIPNNEPIYGPTDQDQPTPPPSTPPQPRPLHCPFCGSNAMVATYQTQRGWFVICMEPSCPVNPKTDPCPTEAEAINAWNTRSEDVDA